MKYRNKNQRLPFRTKHRVVQAWEQGIHIRTKYRVVPARGLTLVCATFVFTFLALQKYYTILCRQERPYSSTADNSSILEVEQVKEVLVQKLDNSNKEWHAMQNSLELSLGDTNITTSSAGKKDDAINIAQQANIKTAQS